MDPVQQLEAAIAQHLGAIQRAASNAPLGGGPEWDGLLRHYGLVPLGPEERAMIVQAMRMVRGAVPAEVRMALVGLQSWARRELDRLRLDPAMEASVGRLEPRVLALVDHETAAYERAMGIAATAPAVPVAPAPAAPAGPSLASIFANAQQTSKEVPWAGMTYKNVGTITCMHCGAPQQQQADFMCTYCRRPIAGVARTST